MNIKLDIEYVVCCFIILPSHAFLIPLLIVYGNINATYNLVVRSTSLHALLLAVIIDAGEEVHSMACK
jgi:hypothetical protein